MPIAPLDPLITFEEVDAAEQHFGKSKHIGQLFKCLVGLGAFPYFSAGAVATKCLYAPHPDADQQNREWGDHRFERLRSGNSSATLREAQFFHDAFAHVFSPDWAARVTLADLMQKPLNELIARLQIEAPMQAADPVQQAFMLAELCDFESASLRLEPDGSRWGAKPEASPPRAMDELPTIQIGTHYFVKATLPNRDSQTLVLELADEPLSMDGSEVRGQVVTDDIVFGDRDQASAFCDPIEAAPVQGRFHYLCLTRDEPWPELPEFLPTDMLRAFLGECLSQRLADEPIAASILSYRVTG